ncbi:MAG TPA: ABC transporter permease [Bryobacteraceae bacterium]|nr:ABC transporter permease [Bryobacteraceae bacterium]
MRRFLAQLVNLFRGGAAEREMTREIEAHLALLEENFLARGLPPDEARLAARQAYGGVEQAKELHRQARSPIWVEHIAKDVRYGARNLLRAPGFTTVAVLTLALGIGANTAIFSVVNAVLLRPLPYKDADRLVTILHNGNGPVATANYIDWRDQSHTFTAVGAADDWTPNISSSSASDKNPPEHLYAMKVTQNMLPLVGVEPLLGRLFVAGEDRVGAEHEVILSYRLWQGRFQGNPNILGRTITLDGDGYRVVGIMPAGFQFAPIWDMHPELWAPEAFGQNIHERDGNHLLVLARLKPGVTLAQARADMATVTARLEKEYPETNRKVRVTPFKENVVGRVETPLLILLGAVGFVLLIACANVAHMLLARTGERQKEIAVRAALGAGRGRMVAQFLTENLLLAGIGAGAGLLLASGGIKVLTALSPAFLPRVEMVRIDSHVAIFLTCVTLLTALAFGLAPALEATSGNLSEALKEGGRADTAGIRRNRLRSFLVASEFAMAFMLLIGAGLMVRSFYALETVNPGFNPHNVLSMIVSVAGTPEERVGGREIFYRELLQKLRALPGVRAAGAINHLPLVGDLWGLAFDIEGRPGPRRGEIPFAAYRIVMPGYFQTMRLPLVSGREISDRDDARAPAVIMLNEQAARAYWPGEPAIGKRMALRGNPGAPDWRTVIGIVANAKIGDLVSNPSPEMYLPALQTPEFLGAGEGAAQMGYITLVVRADGDPAKLIGSVRQTVWSFDRNLPISEVITMDEAVATVNAKPRFEMLLLGLFGVVALILAAAGIYGVMNYSVSRRTREIGIRISLGASSADVLRMVLRQAMLQVLAGAVAGFAGAVLLSKLLTTMLYAVKPTDPATFAGATAVLGIAALVATGVPARKAASIEPMKALRTE